MLWCWNFIGRNVKTIITTSVWSEHGFKIEHSGNIAGI